MKLFDKTRFLLLIIVIIGSFLRLYNLAGIPISLNPDELAIGYNAYSILTTGADEWGNKLLLSLKSFGDWKQPLYPLLTIPLVATAGLNEFSVRFPAAVSGIVGIILVFGITKLLFKKDAIALLSALSFALNPWSIFFSRGAFEPNLATTLLLGGIFFFLKYLGSKKGLYILASTVFFGLSVFTYHPFTILSPLFVFTAFIVFFKKFNKDKWLIASGMLFCLFMAIYVFSLSQGSFGKLSAVGIFNNEGIIYDRVERLRGDYSSENPLIKPLLHNRYLGVSYQLAQSYLLSFSPSFLFDTSGQKLFYAMGSFGNLYLFDVILLAVGTLAMFWKREKFLPVLILWLLIAPIPSAITKEAPSVSRLIGIMPLFTIISGYGAFSLYEIFKQKSKIGLIAIGVLTLLFLTNFIFFLDSYFIHMNTQRARFFHYGYKEAVNIAMRYPKHKVVMVGPQNFAYIAFLFYEKYDPIKFRNGVQYYPPTEEGFYFVKSFGRYEFVEKIDRDKLQPKTLYIDKYRSGDKHVIYYPSLDPAFAYFVTN
ncbi:MAG: glycosyltransferase family 39 protein [Candidatus Levybacteria bacterium]|nr:glycosyltransferase family 39 protein [Candidatus Levybacteria bacterium]